jgi:hypothetical protein
VLIIRGLFPPHVQATSNLKPEEEAEMMLSDSNVDGDHSMTE